MYLTSSAVAGYASKEIYKLKSTESPLDLEHMPPWVLRKQSHEFSGFIFCDYYSLHHYNI